MSKIVIAGGGWAGCAAAVRAAKLGMETVLIEKTEVNVGIMTAFLGTPYFLYLLRKNSSLEK